MAEKTVATKDDLIDAGQKAPAFTLADQSGKKHKLSDYQDKWVVLYFYPKDDTPGCTKQACSFRDNHTDLHKRNVVVLGVSADDEASHEKFADKFSLPFPLLADPTKKVCLKYGVWQEKNNYGKKYEGIVRTTYLIDPQGKVAHRWNRVKPDKQMEQITAKLDELGA